MKSKNTRGFCPSLKKPVFSEDGILVRLRPYMNSLNSDDMIYLCDLSEKYGSGIMEVTTRSSLQIRGINKFNFKKIEKDILNMKSIGHEIDNNSNIIINPFWNYRDENFRIYKLLIKYNLSNLPEKFGFVIDLGNPSCLKNISGDIRFEKSDNNKILVRADGSDRGKALNINQITSFVPKMIEWFINNKEKNINRMSELLKTKKLPHDWCLNKPISKSYNVLPGNYKIGQVFGIKLGRFLAKDLKRLLLKSLSPKVRITPFKMVLLEQVNNHTDKNFICNEDDPFLNLSACSGKNYCSSSFIDTYELANKIKKKTKLKVHIAGCEKNCGITKDTQILLSGRKNFVSFRDFRCQENKTTYKNYNDFSKKFFNDIE